MKINKCVDVLIGSAFGDEGKGKATDYLAVDYDVVCRYSGGSNAGHTIYRGSEKIVLHLVPSGVLSRKTLNIIGSGVVVDPIALVEELKVLEDLEIPISDRLILSQRSHLTLPTHKYLDLASETLRGSSKIGTTGRGICPTHMDRVGRNGLRFCDIFSPDFELKYRSLKMKHIEIITQFNPSYSAMYSNLLKEVVGHDSTHKLAEMDEKFLESIQYLKKFHITNTESLLHELIGQGKKILAEGAQGTGLDIDWGTYPYVTSSNSGVAGAIAGLGIPPTCISDVIAVSKSYTTRVGSGPLVTTIEDDLQEKLVRIGNEYGATTGRVRKCGWLDLPLIKYSCQLNGTTKIFLTKLDVLQELGTIRVCTGYMREGVVLEDYPVNLTDVSPIYRDFESPDQDLSSIKTLDDLPVEIRDFIHFIEEYLDVPVSWISVGKDNSQTIKA